MIRILFRFFKKKGVVSDDADFDQAAFVDTLTFRNEDRLEFSCDSFFHILHADVFTNVANKHAVICRYFTSKELLIFADSFLSDFSTNLASL